MGLSIILINTFYKYQTGDKWKFHWNKIYGFLTLWSVLFAILLAVLIFAVMPKEAAAQRNTIITILFLQSSLFAATTIVGARLFQMLQKPAYISTTTITVGLVTIAANLYTIKYLKMGFMGWYYSGFIGSFLTFVFYLVPLVRRYKVIPSFHFNLKYLKRQLKPAVPTIPHNYSTYILDSSDRMVMDRLDVPIQSLGNYQVGYSFGSYFSFFGTAIGMAQGPIMAKLWFQNEQDSKLKIRSLVFLFQILFLSVGFLLAMWSREIIPVLYRNSAFKDAYVFSTIIFMSYVYFPLYWGSINKLYYSGQTTSLWKIAFVPGIANVILNIIFIPFFGPIAACVTTFCCLMYVGVSGYYVKAYKKLNDVNYHQIKWLAAIVLLTITVFLIKDIDVSYKIAITLGTLVLLALGWGKYKNRLVNILD